MPTEVSLVQSRSDREAFLRLPWSIYRNHPQWVPPILAMQRRELDPKRGHFFNDGFRSRAEFFLARSEGEVVGRIAAIRNERHLAKHDDGVGFFGFFEAIDDVSVAAALFDEAERWLSAEGLVVSRGPTSFTLNDPSGVTVFGGDVRPSVQIAYTPGYYANLLEAGGYYKVRDLLTYQGSVDEMERNLFQYEGAFESNSTAGVEIRTILSSRIEEEAALFTRLFSESWDRNWGSFPMLPEDLVRAHRELGPFFDEGLGGIATVNGKPAGVFLATADPWEIFHRLDGRIGLRGAWRILRERKKIERFRLFIFGSLPEYRKIPIGPMLLRKLQERRPDYPALKTFEFSWILEDNVPTRQLAEAVGARHAQTLRIFEKRIEE